MPTPTMVPLHLPGICTPSHPRYTRSPSGQCSEGPAQGGERGLPR